VTALDLRTKRTDACFGCGQPTDGTALAVWATTSGPILALLCPVCQEDVTVRETLAGHLLAHMDRTAQHVVWTPDGSQTEIRSAPISKDTIITRLIAGESFSFGQ